MAVNSSETTETSFQSMVSTNIQYLRQKEQWSYTVCNIFDYPDVRIDVPVRYEQTFNNYNIVLLWLRIEHTMIHTL